MANEDEDEDEDGDGNADGDGGETASENVGGPRTREGERRQGVGARGERGSWLEPAKFKKKNPNPRRDFPPFCSICPPFPFLFPAM